MDDTTSTVAAIQSIMSAPPPAAPVAPALPVGKTGRSNPALKSLFDPVKHPKSKVLKLLKHSPQPDLRAIADRLGLTQRAAKMHLQILFHAGMITHRRAFYRMTPAGRAWLNYEDGLAAWALMSRMRASVQRSRPAVCPLCQQPIQREETGARP